MKTLTPAQAAVAVLAFLLAATHYRVRVPVAAGAVVSVSPPVLALVVLVLVAVAMLWGIWLMLIRDGFGIVLSGRTVTA